MKRPLRLFLLCGITIGILWLGYLRLRPTSMTDHARTIAYAKLYGDTDILFDYMLPEEPRITGITRASFRDAYKALIEPRLKRFRNVTSETVELLGRGAQGSCRIG